MLPSRSLGLTAATILLSVGLFLLMFSWFSTFPLYLASSGEYTFEKIHPSYWFGLAFSNVGVLSIGTLTNDKKTRLICCFLFVLLSYSNYYFYSVLPGPDSAYFMGLTMGFERTALLVSHNEAQSYYQWPGLFVLAKVVGLVINADVHTTVQALFLAWSLTLAAALYAYFLQRSPTNAHMAAMAFVVAAYPFLYWQFSAQTLSLVFLVCAFNVMAGASNSSKTLFLVIFTAMALSHPFLSVFLILALLLMSLRRPSQYGTQLVLTSVIYLFVLVFQGTFLIGEIGGIGFALLAEYRHVLEVTLAPPSSSIDAFAQSISRIISLTMWALLGVGVLIMILRRRLSNLDVSLFASGVLYFLLGVLVPILGFRAIQIALIPSAQGLQYLHHIRRIRSLVFLYLLISFCLFPVAILHLNYEQLNYVSLQEERAADFLVSSLGHASPESYAVASRLRIARYMEALLPDNTWFIYAPDLKYLGHADYLLVSPEFRDPERPDAQSLTNSPTRDRIFDDCHSQIYLVPRHL